MPPSRHNRSPVPFAVAGAALMMAHHVGAKSVRDSLFLSAFDISALPVMVVAASIFSLALVGPAAWVTTRFTPGRAVPAAFGASAVFFGALWTNEGGWPELTAVVLYLEVVGFGALLTSGFWSVFSEALDPNSVKKSVGKVGAGGSIGLLLGGIVAERVAALVSANAMLLVLAGLHAACAVLIWKVGHRAMALGDSMEHGAPPRSIAKIFGEAPYLRILAGLVVLGTISAAMIDYVFKAEAVAKFAGPDTMVRFFGVFYAGTGFLVFLLQSVVSRAALERIGLAKTTGTLPLSVVLGGFGALLFPGLASIGIARGAEAVFRGSLFRSGYELFYAPIPPEEKRAAKPIIDVGFDRLGDAMGGGIVKLILVLVPMVATQAILSVAVLLGLAGLWVALQLHEAYVRVLEKNLLHRAPGAEAADSLLSSVMLTRPRSLSELIPVPPAASTVDEDEADRHAEAVTALLSRDPDQVRRVLGEPGETPPALIPHLIRLLDANELRPMVAAALAEVAERHQGQLIDTLLDDRWRESVRRRIPPILAKCPTQRVVDGLLLGLQSESLDVRVQCGQALDAIFRRGPNLRLDSDAVYSAVRRETELGLVVLESLLPPGASSASATTQLADDLLRDSGRRCLEHIFTLLSLVLPREPLRIAFRGLHTDDPQLRGTALEYLETLLPAEVRLGLWPYLHDDRMKTRKRSRDEALDDLMKSRAKIHANLDRQRKTDPSAVLPAAGDVPDGASS